MENTLEDYKTVPETQAKPKALDKITTKTYLHFLVLFLGVIAISYFWLSKQSLRLDESQSLFQSSHYPLGVINTISHDVHVPLYGLMLHFWQMFFGTSVAAGRTLSLTFLLLSIPAIYMLGVEAHNRKVGIFASLLVATSPFLNWYGNEMRMYSLLVLVTIINQYFFIRLYNSKARGYSQEFTNNSWLGFALVSLVGIYTHYFFWLVLLTEGLFFLLNRKKFPEHTLRNLLMIAGILIIAIAPWLLYVKSQGGLSNQIPDLAKPNSFDVFNVFSQFMFGFQDDHINTIIVSLWPLSILFAFLTLGKNRRASTLTVFFIVAALFPIAVALTVSIFYRPIFLARYLILSVPPLFIFISWFLSSYPPKVSWVLKGLLASVMLLTLFQQIASANTPSKENYEQASEYITAHATGQDAVILSAPFTIYPFEYYYNGSAAINTIPVWNPYQEGEIPPFSESAMISEVQSLASDHKDIYLLLSYDQGYQNEVFNYFETHFQRLDQQTFSPDLNLYVYQVSYH